MFLFFYFFILFLFLCFFRLLGLWVHWILLSAERLLGVVRLAANGEYCDVF